MRPASESPRRPATISTGSGSTSTPVTTVGVETEHEEEHEHEDEYEHEEEDEHEDEVEHEDGSGSADAQDAWVTARSNAVAAIAAANQVNPGSENLEEAEEKLGEADRAAAKGEWWEAVEKAAEATRKANKAANGG